MASQNRASLQRQAMYMLERCGEPVFIPKGNGKFAFNLPMDLLADRFRPYASALATRFKEDATGDREIVDLVPIKIIPDLAEVNAIPRTECFSIFLPKHNQAAARLIDVFMGARSVQDFMSLSAYCRDRINTDLFVYAYSVALIHRRDTRGIQIPSIAEIFPSKCIPAVNIRQAREMASVLDEDQRTPIEIPPEFTASDLDPEHRVAYFREDIGINEHHWHWHLVYPFNASPEIVNKDRRGELFYYMHHQVMARYNAERLSNHLRMVEKLRDLRQPLAEGYFPKLTNENSGRIWPGRPNDMTLQDLNRPDLNTFVGLQDMERWRNRIEESIQRRQVNNIRNEVVPLTEERGIDILGNMMEPSILSPSPDLYGLFHNSGHNVISLVHDPDGRHLEGVGVMAETMTAMRDPIFYRWHALIDDIFVQHKNLLSPYTTVDLGFPGIRLLSVDVMSRGMARNSLGTFWQQVDIDVSRGLDFTRTGTLAVRITQLNHQDIAYRIVVENTLSRGVVGTVRIFMAPRLDERGSEMRFELQKNLMIELDKFQRSLAPGMNTIDRRDADSSVTIPFEQTFQRIETDPTLAGDSVSFCGCGWPQHMLIPKGKEEGMPFELFVMITNWEQDKVEDSDLPRSSDGCQESPSYCGLRGRRYPDRRAMGFPFDRRPRQGVITFADFRLGLPNMIAQRVIIKHTNRVASPPVQQ